MLLASLKPMKVDMLSISIHLWFYPTFCAFLANADLVITYVCRVLSPKGSVLLVQICAINEFSIQMLFEIMGFAFR